MTALVVGYGNPLRSDDGVGWRVAERIARDPRVAGVEILQRHQLTPELALDVSRADLVVLVDATTASPAGTVAVEAVGAASTSLTTWSHHLGPASLVALARELYGLAPEVHVVSVGVASLEIGQQLSPAVEAAVDRVIETVIGLVGGQAGSLPDDVAAASHA